MRALLALGWAVAAVVPFVLCCWDSPPGPRPSRRPVTGPGGVGSPGPAAERAPAVPAGDVALAADLLAVAITGGLTPFLALELASGTAPASVAAPVRRVLGAVGEGRRLVHALEAEAARNPDLRALLELLATSERSGASVGPLLTRLAATERGRLRLDALTRARKVPVRLLFPLVFLLFPAFLVLTVGPALIAGLR